MSLRLRDFGSGAENLPGEGGGGDLAMQGLQCERCCRTFSARETRTEGL